MRAHSRSRFTTLEIRRPRRSSATAALTPSSATVHGPTGLLSEVASIRVDVPMPSAPQAYDAMVRPVPVNSLGQEIAGVEVAPDLVRVQIHFVAGTGAKPKP